MPSNDGARHDRVPDVELDDLGNRGDRLHVLIVQAVPGVHLEPEAGGVARGVAQSLAARAPAAAPRGICVSAGMQLDGRRTDPHGRFELRRIRIHEQRQPECRRRRGCGRGLSAATCDAASRPPSVVTSARRSGTRQQSAGRTAQAMRTISSVTAISKFIRVCSRSRQARISRSWMCRRSSRRCIVMLSAPACSAMQRGVHRVRIARAPRLAQRGDVVDVDSEMQHGRHW